MMYLDRRFPFRTRQGRPVTGGRGFQYFGAGDCHLRLEVFDSSLIVLVARDVVDDYSVHRGSETTERILDQLRQPGFVM